jgi:hypothetical protein
MELSAVNPENRLPDDIVEYGRSIFERGLAHWATRFDGRSK